ncbi:MAG: glycoside hydrolase/phage tail family protein [Pseudomonadota bacterium]
MAQVVLGGIGGAIGGGFGQAVGAALGAGLDRAFIAGLAPARQRGPRLEGLKVQSSAEGAPMACVFGRARVTGQVIWAARFLEKKHTQSAGKGGPRTVDYAYSLSFAVALCEGPIDGVGRVWADGRPLDLSGVTMRVHRGTGNQTPDALIEAVEGAAPAYRGTAYVVFEDLPLTAFGNRPPQLSFEVFRRPRGSTPSLEDRIEGVCLIPGAGEFVLATEPVMRREGLTRTVAENVNNAEGRADFEVSLDQLMAQAPNLKRVSLVIGWFGNDVRAEHCRVRPGVERRDKATEPVEWSVAGLDRSEAHLVSQVEGAPAYGGTPSDESVRQAVASLKARGLEVTLYPFVFMDCEGYPWRGRVAGRDGADAAGDVAAVFGEADGWGLRRLALHYAALAAETGADGLLIGSEMRGLTWTRDAVGGFPAVTALRALAGECRAVVGPDVALSYAADWSEYFGRHDGDDVMFHLDPLWADPAIDYVGIDWYPPLGDWRDGDGGVDAEAFSGPADAAYLAAQVAGGEGFDWFYADDADRAAQVRTPVADTAHGEDWVFKPKDLKGWWANAHHDRPGGVRSPTPTAWVPGMKPIRLTEFGCAAVDRGGNAPNRFVDPKSVESGLPPFSTGVRADLMQRRALEAVVGHFGSIENNPVSEVYDGQMLAGMDAWCWDARPYPAFPARSDLWADAGAWAAGHWLNGRLSGETRDLLAAVLKRAGLSGEDMRIEGVEGDIAGYVIDRPMRTRDALEPLVAALNLTVAERGGQVAVLGAPERVTVLDEAALALPDDGVSVRADRSLEARPGVARVRFIDEATDFQTGTATVRGDGEAGGIDLDLPAVCGAGLARSAAARLLAVGAEDRLTAALDPLAALRLEAGDVVSLSGREGDWRISRVSLDETPAAVLEPVVAFEAAAETLDWRGGDDAAVGGAPYFRLLDLPPLPGREDDGRPLAVVAADPWRAMQVHAGPSSGALTLRGAVAASATVGVLTTPLAPGVRHRWDEANVIEVRIEGRAPESLSDEAVLAGGNALAVETADGWEIGQFRQAAPVGGGVWRLTGLLRGQQGTDSEMRAGAEAGADVVLLDRDLPRVESGPDERGLPLVWRAGPAGGAPGGVGFSSREETVHGLRERPWSPCRLRVEDGEDGLTIQWMARLRTGADSWEREAAAVDAARWRVRILAGEAEVRTFEVESETALYEAADVTTDWPGGVGDEAVVAVAQWSAGFGWGVETATRLNAT